MGDLFNDSDDLVKNKKNMFSLKFTPTIKMRKKLLSDRRKSSKKIVIAEAEIYFVTKPIKYSSLSISLVNKIKSDFTTKLTVKMNNSYCFMYVIVC